MQTIKVNGEVIPQDAIQFELERLVRFYAEHGMSQEQIRAQLKTLAQQAAQQAIGTKLLLDEAARLDLPVSDAEVDEQVEKIVLQVGGREVFIEREDFLEEPAKKFFRMAPGQEVRLRAACLFTCTHAVKDAAGKIVEIHGTYDPNSKGGNAADGRKIKGTIHWVSAAHAVPVEVRLYDRLFTVPDPLGDATRDFVEFLNPDSFKAVTAFAEPALTDALPGALFQFERIGYFCADTRESMPGNPVFNRTVTLKDSWTKAGK